MSTTSITILVTTAAFVVCFWGLLAWLGHRSDMRRRQREAESDRSRAIRQLERDSNLRIAGIEREVVALRMRLARLEGPSPREIRVR